MIRARCLLLLAVLVSCKPGPRQQTPRAGAGAGPQVRATVITIRTTVAPENKSYEETVVIANDRARNTGEHDTWRLYDTKASTVTYVDDVEKTIRTEAWSAAVKRRAAANATTLPPHFPLAHFVRGTAQRQLQGATARQVVIESGAYRRELWLAEHPSIPRGLFAIMHASETPSSPAAPMMRAVDAALAAETGFPLADRTTLPGKTNRVIERTVTTIAQRDVPEAILALPKGYRDVTPKAPR